MSAIGVEIVRTVQFDTILNEPSVIIIQMRVNTCLPESVPRVIPHLETRITDTSFIQNNIKSGSPGMCSNIRPESAYAHTVYKSNTSPRIHKEQFYTIRVHSLILQIQRRWVSNFTYKPWAHDSHIKQNHKVYCIYMLSRNSIAKKTY